MSNVMSRNEMADLCAAANIAGVRAAQALTPDPMFISGYAPVLDGVCGFAWVTIRPGNSRFANFLKQQGLASKAYGGGVQVWINPYNQSMQKKAAHAEAMARVFREAGIDAVAQSRMD